MTDSPLNRMRGKHGRLALGAQNATRDYDPPQPEFDQSAFYPPGWGETLKRAERDEAERNAHSFTFPNPIRKTGVTSLADTPKIKSNWFLDNLGAANRPYNLGEVIPKPLMDLIMMGVGFTGLGSIPSRLYFGADAMGQNNPTGVAANALPVRGIQAAVPTLMDVFGSTALNAGERKRYAGGGVVGTLRGPDPNIQTAGFRPEYNYFDWSTGPNNAVDLNTQTQVGTPSPSVAFNNRAPYSPNSGNGGSGDGYGDGYGTPAGAPGGVMSPETASSLISSITNPSSSTIGSAIGTGVGALTGTTGLGVLGSIGGSLYDTFRSNANLNTMENENPVVSYDRLGFKDALSAIGNGLTFGWAGRSANDTMAANVAAGNAAAAAKAGYESQVVDMNDYNAQAAVPQSYQSGPTSDPFGGFDPSSSYGSSSALSSDQMASGGFVRSSPLKMMRNLNG